ncbi:MAG: B12-binding domain-containing radical SAM protein [Candidatus Bathyarchaeota archaeon]|nr:B12-binding domain-containing radical SAM protein [Candidatus Termiticorpusculum sp.]
MILLMTTAPPSNAPWFHGKRLPPLGLMYIAAALEQAGHEVQMLDNYLMQQSTEEVQQLVLKLQPTIVGITCGSATYKKCVETAKAIKTVAPNCKIVVGGWHASYMPESLLETPEIDYAVIGEGERAITNLAEFILKEDYLGASNVAGIACRSTTGVIKNEPCFINMDELPFPARHLLPLEKYDRNIEFLKAKPADVMSISRGCTFNCGFCETTKLWGNINRQFSPQRVIAEVNDLVNKYGTRGIYFINDNFTMRKNQTAEFCDLLIKSKLDIEWVCDTRVDLVNQEILEKMASAGCKTIWFGIESGSQKVLNHINRNITLEQIEEAFKMCRKAGIQIACSFMLGMPSETRDDLIASYRFAEKLNADWCQFNVFIAYPDSPLWREMLETGKYTQLDDFLYSYKTDEFDYDELMRIQKQFFRDYHRAPKRILQRIQREGVLNFAKRRLSLNPFDNAGIA